jgi:hypothetical protein
VTKLDFGAGDKADLEKKANLVLTTMIGLHRILAAVITKRFSLDFVQ